MTQNYSQDKNEDTSQKSNILSSSLRASNNCIPHLIFTRSQNMHLFFVESGLLVLSDTINRLNLVKMLLKSVEKTHDAFGDDIGVASKIEFNEFDPEVLDALDSLQVPLKPRDESPFLYHFPYLGSFLELPVNITKFFEAIVELLYNELRIQYSKKLFFGYGYNEPYELTITKEQKAEILQSFQDEELPITDESLLIGSFYGFPKPQFGAIEVEYRTGRASWLLIDSLIRIRAQWDKLIKLFLLENYFQVKPNDKFDKCLRKVEREAKKRKEFTQSQQHCLEVVLSLGKSIDELRHWRDNDIHNISPRVLGVLETRTSSSSLSELWEFLLIEHNKVREAFIAAIGVVGLGQQVSFNAVSVAWPMPTHYPDITDENDVKLLAELRYAMEFVIQLRELCEQDVNLKSTNFLQDAELKAINLARKLYKFNRHSNAPYR